MRSAVNKEVAKLWNSHAEAFNRLADSLEEHNIDRALLDNFVEVINQFQSYNKEQIYKEGLDNGFKSGWLAAEKYSLIIKESQCEQNHGSTPNAC